jgi:ribosomal protein S18 acetylase RimI-like enzyme
LSEVAIRACRPDEIDEVLELWRVAESPESIGADPGGVANLLRHDSEALVVAELDGRIVGTLILGWDGWRANLYRLAVLPDMRRNGIARALVRTAESRLRIRGMRKCSAIVLSDNDRAVAFWEAVGYDVQSEVGRYVRTFG